MAAKPCMHIGPPGLELPIPGVCAYVCAPCSTGAVLFCSVPIQPVFMLSGSLCSLPCTRSALRRSRSSRWSPAYKATQSTCDHAPPLRPTSSPTGSFPISQLKNCLYLTMLTMIFEYLYTAIGLVITIYKNFWLTSLFFSLLIRFCNFQPYTVCSSHMSHYTDWACTVHGPLRNGCKLWYLHTNVTFLWPG